MSASPFYTARLAEWKQQIRMWPVTITNNNETAICIRTPDKRGMVMQGNNYMDVIETTVDMLREDAVRLDLIPTSTIPRPRFMVIPQPDADGIPFEIQKIDNDENEPTVQARCRRVQ